MRHEPPRKRIFIGLKVNLEIANELAALAAVLKAISTACDLGANSGKRREHFPDAPHRQESGL